MEIYIFIYFTTFFMINLNPIRIIIFKKARYVKPVLIVFILLLFVVGFRDSMGLDDIMYKNTIKQIINYGYSERQIEGSFVLIARILGAFGLNYQALFLLYSAITYIFFGLCIKEIKDFENYKQIFILLFLVFIFPNSFTAMRQYAGMAMLSYGYFMQHNKKYYYTVLLYFLAFSLHESLLFVIILILLNKYFIKIKTTFKIVSLLIAYIIQYIPINKFISGFIIRNINFTILNKLKDYLMTENMFSTTFGLVDTFCLLLFILILVLHKKQNNEEDNQKEHIMSLGYQFYIFSLFLNQFGWVLRIPFSLMFFNCISLSYITDCFALKQQKLIKIILFFVFSFLFFYTIKTYSSRSNIKPFLPYLANFKLFG